MDSDTTQDNIDYLVLCARDGNIAALLQSGLPPEALFSLGRLAQAYSDLNLLHSRVTTLHLQIDDLKTSLTRTALEL